MKKGLNLLSIAMWLIATATHSQVAVNSGSQYSIRSSVYEMNREIQVYTPEGYEKSENPYPVLYVLDGQRWYMQAVSYQRLFQEYGYSPDFIVVGINTEDGGRYGFFNNSEKLQEYIEKDVIEFVESNFSTSDERLLFGWQFAGAFTIRTLIQQPDMFNAFIAASPIPINGSLLNSASDLSNKTLYISTSHVEDQVNNGVADFVSKLDSMSTSLRWNREETSHEQISSFGHRTTPLSALYQGLRFHYSDYPILEFDKIDRFRSLGGFDYVNSYYENRSKKYGISNQIPLEGMFFMLRLGLNEKDYSVFQKYMREYIKADFLKNENLGWGTRFGQFSLQNEDYELATAIYETLKVSFPESARPIHGLGTVYLAQNKKREARKLFESAIKKAEKNGDRRLEQYQADLDAIK